MSASKVLDLAEKQGLLEPKVIADLRRQVAESKFVVTPEALAKVLVDHEHLTPFQARKLVASALGEPPPEPEPPQRIRSGPAVPDELTLADDDSSDAGLPSPPADDVVLLEAVDSPPTQKSAFSPPPPGQAKSQRRREKSKLVEDEIIDLEPVTPAAPAPATAPSSRPKAPIWKKDNRPVPPSSAASVTRELPPLVPVSAPAAVLTPLPPAQPSTAPAPLEDLFHDPLTGQRDPLDNSAALGAPPAKPKKVRKNVWDSPLLLIGGGLLGCLVVAVVLLGFSLTWGNAAELLAKADEEYKVGSYTNAIELYEQFLRSYASDANASHARVRLGMAQLRQVSDEGRNPKSGLTTAKVVLPQIEKEEQFSGARPELATLLPDIADGFATQAAEAATTADKEALVKLADEAMLLVNTPSYLPASLRKEREARIAAILDKLKVAQRGIQQDKDLVTALASIAAAEKQGDAAAAYQVRGDLLKIYPGLEANAELIAAIRKVGDKERDLVKAGGPPVAAATDDPDAGPAQVVLAVREGPEPAATAASVAYVQLAGAVYGLDAASGNVLWRRFVGHESLLTPQRVSRAAGADVLLVDARRHELLRLEARTGKLLWRQPIGQPLLAPTIIGERIFVTTAAGGILQIDAASGEISRSVALPQPASVAAAVDARQSRLVQLGQHSTVFVLSSQSLECSQTYYLGHARGSILVPPAAVLDYVLAVESPADDYTLIHVLTATGEKKQLAEVGQPFRLKGRVTMPLTVAGRRVAAITDLGQIAVYEVDSANRQQPVRVVATLDATEKQPGQIHYAMDGNRLWVARGRCSLYEIQSSLQNLARKWSRHQDDVFIAPIQALEDVLIHVRRRPGAPAVIVEGCQPDGGQTVWTTQLAIPVVGLFPAPARQAVDAITQQGRVFPLTSEQLRGGIHQSPAFALPQGSAGAIWPELDAAPAGNLVVWTESQAGGRVLAYNPADGRPPRVMSPAEGADRSANAAAIWGGNVLAPRSSGKVELLGIASEKPSGLPFLPPLVPGESPAWTRPAVLAGGSGFVIGDGAQMLYRVAFRDQPQPHLAAAGEQALAQPLTGGLVAVGESIFGLVKGDAGDVVVAIDPQSLAQTAKWPLADRAQFGPELVGGLAFVSSQADGLLCLEAGDKLRWQKPLAHGPLSGPPQAGAAGELLLLYQSGKLARISAESGDELAATDIGQPLGRAACLVDQQVLVSTSDGALLLVPQP